MVTAFYHVFPPQFGQYDILSNDLKTLFLNPELSDLTIIVGGQKFCAHKLIISARCDYLKTLYSTEPPTNEIEVEGISIQMFKDLLHYIYTGRLSFVYKNEMDIMITLNIVDRYGFFDVVSLLLDYLRKLLRFDNVFWLLNVARSYNCELVIKMCNDFISNHQLQCLEDKAFFRLDSDSLFDLLKMDSFHRNEKYVIDQLFEWLKENKDVDPKLVFGKLKLHLLSEDVLNNKIKPTGYVPIELIEEARVLRRELRDAQRVTAEFNKNLATNNRGARVIEGYHPRNLLDGNIWGYWGQSGRTTYHWITGKPEDHILLDLGKIYEGVNHMKLLMYGLGHFKYSFYIEVSIDHSHWDKVFECPLNSAYWQYVNMVPHDVRYIRIVGTECNLSEQFHLVHFECSCLENSQKIVPRPRHGWSRLTRIDGREEIHRLMKARFSKYPAKRTAEENKNLI